MRCRYARHLRAYLDDELPLPQREELRRHLGGCPACADEVEGLQRVAALLSELSPTATPEHLASATLLRLRSQPTPSSLFFRHAPAAAGAIAAAACLMLALHVMMPGRSASSPTAPLRLVSAAEIISPAAVIMSPVARPTAPRLLAQAHAISVPVPVRRHVELAPVVTKAAVKTVAARPTAPRADASEARAQAALNSIRRRVSADDPDLLAAALENVALTYPGTGSAAQALLTAADLQRSRGNLAEADASYRRLLSMKGTAAMPRALAHKALADLRSDAVGDDAVTRHHYQEAARALRTETQGGAARPQALVAMADIARETGNRTEAVADYAAAASQGAGEQATTALAEVL